MKTSKPSKRLKIFFDVIREYENVTLRRNR